VISRLIVALIDISKLESGAMKPEPINFEEMRTEFWSMAANKGVQLQIEAYQDTVRSRSISDRADSKSV
jgi:hypothetical protein